MSVQSLFDLSELTVSSISVSSTDGLPQNLTDGHAMTELAGSSVCGRCTPSSTTGFFGDEDDLV
ncbi:hypothetical protein ACIP98_39795 [Streptomyces sp. NPDC088354]|uniref:hypothetical protein n=1 Tax=Streptomyces sp. NPDC088354 TaxID=3365856 RepID=UPI00382D0008